LVGRSFFTRWPPPLVGCRQCGLRTAGTRLAIQLRLLEMDAGRTPGPPASESVGKGEREQRPECEFYRCPRYGIIVRPATGLSRWSAGSSSAPAARRTAHHGQTCSTVAGSGRNGRDRHSAPRGISPRVADPKTSKRQISFHRRHVSRYADYLSTLRSGGLRPVWQLLSSD
jgi:hypothetical protein